MKKKISKRYEKLLSLTKNKKAETIDDAIKMVKKNCTAKFDESIDVSFHLNLKSKKEEVNLRTVVKLPDEPRPVPAGISAIQLISILDGLIFNKLSASLKIGCSISSNLVTLSGLE